MGESEVIVKKGLTLPVLIAGVLLCALFSIYFQIVLNMVGGGYSTSGYSDIAMKVMTHRAVDNVAGVDRFVVRNSQAWPLAMGLFIIVNIVAAYIVKAQGRKGTSPGILILLAMLSASLIVNINNGNALNQTQWNHGNQLGARLYEREATAEEWALVPSLMAVTDVAVWESIMPVSTWTLPGAFYPVIAWNILLYGSMTMFFIFLSMILKVLWFDVEAIPPLWAEVQKQSLVLVNETVQGGVAGASGRKNWFLVGILVQAAITLLFSSGGVIDDIVNGPSEPMDWSLQGLLIGTDIQAPYISDIAQLAILPWVALFVSLQPFQIAFSYLIPLDILYSALLGWAIFKFVIPVSFTSMGLLGPFTGDRTRNVHRVLIRDQFVGADWAAGLGSGISLGMIVGLAIYPLIRYRARVIPMLQSLTGGGDKSLEQLSPLPLRIVWLGMIGCAVIFLGCWAAVGANMSVIIVTMLLNMLLTIGATRAGLYTAGTNFINEFTSGGDNYRAPYVMPGHLSLNYIAPNPTATSGNAATWFAVGRVQGFMGQMNTQSQVLAHSLYSYKISEGFNINLKNTGIALILGFGAAIVAGVVGWQLKYAVLPFIRGGPLGDATWLDRVNRLVDNFGQGLWYSAARRPMPTLLALGDAGLPQYVGYCVVGFVLVPLMLLVRKAVPQFRMLPEGLVFGAFLSGESYVIPAFFVGMVVRVITYKTGQVKAHNEVIQPLCMGLIVGYFIPIAILISIQMFYNIPAWQLWRLSQV